MSDPLDLQRFIQAQNRNYADALSELRAGQKTSHWMWYVFPQLQGLGISPMAQHYALSGLDEARAYLAHPTLGGRLRTCTAVVNEIAGRTAHAVFGSPDDMKFHSSMTLFAAADPADLAFKQALDRYFAGKRDEKTLGILAKT